MRNDFRWMLAAAVAIGGCASEVGAPVDEVASSGIEWIDARTFEALEDGVDVWLDLRTPATGYAVDTDAVPLDRVALVCPNGQIMAWDEWVAADPALAEHATGLVGISSDPRIAEIAAADEEDAGCPPDCYVCKDGVTLCHEDWDCLGGGSAGPVENVLERDVWRHLWVEGALPTGSDAPPGEGSETGSGGDVPDPDPTPSGGSGDSGGSSGSSGSSGGSYGSGGSGGSSPGGHPGWG